MATRPIADGLFTAGAAPELLGGRHRHTGRIVFPCPDGSEGALYDAVPIGRDGTLWSWTIQRFRPKSPPYAGPDGFEPFALGYVALPRAAIVVARLTGMGFDAIAVGMKLSLCVVPFTTDPDGTVVLTYAFGPAEQATA